MEKEDGEKGLFVFAASCFSSVPAEMETAWYFSFLARNHRVTKPAGCHKRTKPGVGVMVEGGWRDAEMQKKTVRSIWI